MVKVDARTTSEGVVAMRGGSMTGSIKECQKECAVIPASVLEQYAQALRQQGIEELSDFNDQLYGALAFIQRNATIESRWEFKLGA